MKIRDAESLLQAVRAARGLLEGPQGTRSKQISKLRNILFAPDVTAIVEARYPPPTVAKP